MMKHVADALRSDRGDVGIIPTIIGSILFLFATIMVTGMLTLTLGATALAQANSDLVSKFRSEVQVWEKSSWADLEKARLKAGSTTDIVGGAVHTSAPVTTVAGGREYKVYTRVLYDAASTSYKMTKTSQRAVTPGQKAIDCLPELTGTKTTGCISVSGTLAATPDDIAPKSPAGVTVPAALAITTPGGGLPPYLKVADLDRSKIRGDQQLRISFQNPAGVGAGNMSVGLYCTADAGSIAISQAVMSFDGATNSYYARVGLADFDRLEYCTAPNLRLTSATNKLPTPATIKGSLAVLKALANSNGS
jgi:hypothetical protein